MSISTFYLSRVERAAVVTSAGDKIGRLKDLAIDMTMQRPIVVAASVKTGQGLQLLDFSHFSVKKDKRQYTLVCDVIKPSETPAENLIYLKQNVQDRQIIDINGKKIYRVNDVRMAVLNVGTFAVAVDVGLEGLLRRLSFAKPLSVLLNIFKVKLPAKFILWDDIGAIDFSNTTYTGIKLSIAYEKLSRLNPSDLADIIEDLDKNAQMAIFASLDDERAADVMEELESDAQVSVIKSMSTEDAADILEIMPADEAADILDELGEEKAEELLQEMETSASDEVRELMEYEEGTVGSFMSTDYISFSAQWTVAQTLEELRRQKPESSWVYYLFILDEQNRLVAMVPLRDVVVSEPEVKLEDIMDEEVICVYDDEQISAMNEMISKYNLICIPVVDREMHMMGVVVIEDVVYNLLNSRRRRS
ncbi:MAG TPA: CBS domain-containing protein [Clostridia bacterium]